MLNYDYTVLDAYIEPTKREYKLSEKLMSHNICSALAIFVFFLGLEILPDYILGKETLNNGPLIAWLVIEGGCFFYALLTKKAWDARERVDSYLALTNPALLKQLLEKRDNRLMKGVMAALFIFGAGAGAASRGGNSRRSDSWRESDIKSKEQRVSALAQNLANAKNPTERQVYEKQLREAQARLDLANAEYIASATGKIDSGSSSAAKAAADKVISMGNNISNTNDPVAKEGYRKMYEQAKAELSVENAKMIARSISKNK